MRVCSKQGIVLLVIGRAGVVQDQKLDRMAVAPKMFVVLLDGFADVAETVSGNNEK